MTQPTPVKGPIIYGAITAVAVFFVGFTTGMGGSLVPNLVFSVVMGAFAAVLYGYVIRRMARGRDDG